VVLFLTSMMLMVLSVAVVARQLKLRLLLLLLFPMLMWVPSPLLGEDVDSGWSVCLLAGGRLSSCSFSYTYSTGPTKERNISFAQQQSHFLAVPFFQLCAPVPQDQLVLFIATGERPRMLTPYCRF
jgi:hypothetical protein